jgi:hypothetical protein
MNGVVVRRHTITVIDVAGHFKKITLVTLKRKVIHLEIVGDTSGASAVLAAQAKNPTDLLVEAIAENVRLARPFRPRSRSCPTLSPAGS